MLRVMSGRTLKKFGDKMYKMNGIILNIVRTFGYTGWRSDLPSNSHEFLAEGTQCFELKSEGGRYSFVGDGQALSQLELV